MTGIETGTVTGGLDPTLLTAVEQLVARAAPGRPLLVATDFDGVLAPLVDDPVASRPTPAASAALSRIAAEPAARVRLALVSGRTLESLAALALPPSGTVLIGSHGAERGEVIPTAQHVVRTPFALSEAEAAQLEEVRSGLAQIAGEVEGAWVEDKPSAAVLHTRMSAAEGSARAAEAAHDLGSALGAHVMSGKDVVEIAVVATSKGQALTALARELDAAAVFYMGDDVTDERAFEVLGPDDLTVKVGPGDTAARFRVATTEAAAEVLTAVADALHGPGSPPPDPSGHE